MSRRPPRSSVDVDLSSRAAGFAGVFAALVVAGMLTDYVFLTAPEREYPPLLLEIRAEALLSNVSSGEQPPAPPEQPPAVHQAVQPAPPPRRSAAAPRAPRPSPDVRQPAPPPPLSSQAVRNTPAAPNGAKRAQQESEQQARRFVAGAILEQIRSSLTYPPGALRRKLQGTVIMEFTIERGLITAFRVARSSGHAILDSAAARLGEQLIGFDTHYMEHSLVLNVPIKYALIR